MDVGSFIKIASQVALAVKSEKYICDMLNDKLKIS